ncbi:MAG TPA: DUF885 domain-containing protein [Acidimicrobiales bacterium]|nr:DUF885 domain-containing protein [Acidimicrobiales bacterium]
MGYREDCDRIAAAQGTTTDGERLHELFDVAWAYEMAESPEAATFNGVPGHDDRWTDMSAEAFERRRAETPAPQVVLDSIDRATLSPDDQLSFDLFAYNLELRTEALPFPGELQPVNQMGGVHQDPAMVLSAMPATTSEHFANMVARLRGIPAAVDQTLELLARGLAAGVTPPQVTLRDVVDQVTAQMDDGPDNPLLTTFAEIPATVPDADAARLREEATAAVRHQVIPAFERLRTYLADTYIPQARTTIAAHDLPDGEAWYRQLVRYYTTTELSPTEIHEIGQAEVARIRAEMNDVIAQTDFNGTFEEFGEFLRSDPQFTAPSAEELLRGYRDIAKRIDPELCRMFGTLPRLPYGVLPVPSYAEKSQTTAYYLPGSPEAGRPGYFFANTYDLPSRPTWEMEALTLHEAVPGHHLQIALASELENVPDFRRLSWDYTGFVEGWGLYAESLGDELGLYKDPYSRFGKLVYEMWRAIRLVVDTGMHALGWTRDQAIAFFTTNTGKTGHDIVVEVDRYIVWPGQALAYKLGELRFKALRAHAESTLGDRFDVRRFHDQCLGQGPLPLEVLDTRIRAWVDGQ